MSLDTDFTAKQAVPGAFMRTVEFREIPNKN